MATFTVTVPDQYVADLTAAIGVRMDGVDDPTVRAIAQKVVAGQATTPTEKRSLAEAFCQRALRQAWASWRSQEAARTRRAQDDVAAW